MHLIIKTSNNSWENQLCRNLQGVFSKKIILTDVSWDLIFNKSTRETQCVFVDYENFEQIKDRFLSTKHNGNKQDIRLILLAENADLGIDCIKLGFYDYFQLPILKTEVEGFSKRLSIEQFHKMNASAKNYLLIRDYKSITKLQYSNILFIEAYGSYSNIYTSDKFYTISKTIKSIINDFPETFVRVHRSYAVNLEHVRSYNTEEVIMNNETRIKISRAKKMALLEAIQKSA